MDLALERTEMKYPKHDPHHPVIAVDFDGVLAENTWPSPDLGTPDYDAIRLVTHYERQDCEIVIFTARPESHFPRIWKWLERLGLDYAVYDVTNKKPQACLYFDDRAVRWPLKNCDVEFCTGDCLGCEA